MNGGASAGSPGQPLAAKPGLRDVEVAAIGEIWSGLELVIRKERH